MPDAAIGADVMVGFPGETEADFEENRRFIAGLPFTYLHVFTYSERPDTLASRSASPMTPPLSRKIFLTFPATSPASLVSPRVG
jgi:threonylcarbamoyladenosine tRNA methylthiotransferase MtaB